MIINQNILLILRTFLNLKKKKNKPPGKDGFKAELYKHSPNELASVLLDVHGSWRKLNTMGVTYRTGIISAIYKNR